MSELLDRALEAMRELRQPMREGGLELVGVVGSVARGDDGPESDVDIIGRDLGRMTFFKLFEIEQELAARLGRPVEIVLSEAMKPERRRYLERDLVLA